MLLIIDKSLKNARTILDLFHFMGVLSSATTPEDASKEISNRYRAVIISNPELVRGGDEFIKMLKTFSLGAPVFALCSDPEKFIHEDRSYALSFDGMLHIGMSSSDMLTSITEYQTEHKLKLIGDYKLSGIDASVFRNRAAYFDTELPFTKTECMILRFLIRSYPAFSPTKSLLKYAFRPSKVPEIQNIRTHVSVMNKKFRQITGRNIIISEPKSGYTVLTPEMAENIF